MFYVYIYIYLYLYKYIEVLTSINSQRKSSNHLTEDRIITAGHTKQELAIRRNFLQ